MSFGVKPFGDDLADVDNAGCERPPVLEPGRVEVGNETAAFSGFPGTPGQHPANPEHVTNLGEGNGAL